MSSGDFVTELEHSVNQHLATVEAAAEAAKARIAAALSGVRVASTASVTEEPTARTRVAAGPVVSFDYAFEDDPSTQFTNE